MADTTQIVPRGDPGRRTPGGIATIRKSWFGGGDASSASGERFETRDPNGAPPPTLYGRRITPPITPDGD